MSTNWIKQIAHDIMDSPDYETIRDAKIGQGYENTLAMLVPAHILLHTLAQQDADKRHSQDTTPSTGTLPIVNNPEIVAWLRSLAPLTDVDIYNNSWKD